MTDTVTSIFELEEFKHLAQPFRKRQKRFQRFWQYYKAEVYRGASKDGLSEWGALINQRMQDALLPLFTPLARAVRIDVALIPGGWELAPESEQHTEAVKQLFMASAWSVFGDIFVRYFAAMGEAGIYLAAADEEISLHPIRPDRYIIEMASRISRRPGRIVMIDMTKDGEGEDVELATVINEELVREFRNGEELLFDGNKGYEHGLGFVPVVVCKNDPGDGEGEPTFDDAIASLDQANQQASYLASIIQKHAEPQWAALGAEAGDLEKSGDTVWFFPEGSDVKAVLAAVDFQGVLDFIKDVKTEVKDSLPELALTKLVGVERVAAATIELQMAETVFKIRQMRKPIDFCLAEAIQLSGKAAAKFKNSDLSTLDDDALELNPDRPVISLDAMTKLQIEAAEMSKEQQALALQRDQRLLVAQSGEEGGE